MKFSDLLNCVNAHRRATDGDGEEKRISFFRWLQLVTFRQFIQTVTTILPHEVLQQSSYRYTRLGNCLFGGRKYFFCEHCLLISG